MSTSVESGYGTLLRTVAASIQTSDPDASQALERASADVEEIIADAKHVRDAALALADIKLAGESEPFWEAFLALREALGLESDAASWAHRVRFGHWPETVWMGLCGICAPWPCCGATGFDHKEGCGDA